MDDEFKDELMTNLNNDLIKVFETHAQFLDKEDLLFSYLSFAISGIYASSQTEGMAQTFIKFVQDMVIDSRNKIKLSANHENQ